MMAIGTNLLVMLAWAVHVLVSSECGWLPFSETGFSCTHYTDFNTGKAWV